MVIILSHKRSYESMICNLQKPSLQMLTKLVRISTLTRTQTLDGVITRKGFLMNIYAPTSIYKALQTASPTPSGQYQLPTISFLRRFFHSRAPPAAMSAAKTKAQQIIDENAVAVFSKSYCPYCKATKQLLSEEGAKFYLIELDEVDDGSAIQDALADMTGQRSVPNVFIGKKHIGGNSDLQATKESGLKQMLKDAGAL